MNIEFGKSKKDIIRYIILGLLYIVGIILTWDGGLEIKFIYTWLLFLGVVRVSFKRDLSFLEDIFYPLHAFVIGSYINHALFLYNSIMVELLEVKSVTLYSIFMLKWGGYIVEFCVIVGIYFLLRLCCVKAKVSAIIAPVPTLILCLADLFVFYFRNNELSPLDFLSIRTAMNVVGNYVFPFKRPLMLAYIPFTLFVFSVFVFKGKSSKAKVSLKKRIISSSVFLVLIVSCVCTAYFSTLELSKTRKVEYFGSKPACGNGFITNFAMQIQNLKPRKPSGYDASQFADLYSAPSSPEDKPTIIVIMNESWADLSIYEDQIGTFEEVMPYIRGMADMENTISGYAYSSVFGGNTANSEFEFLTGLTMAGLPNGSVPYSLYLSESVYSLPRYLSMLGYETIAMHPYSSSSWNRTMAYPNLGFDSMMYVDDFSYQESDLIRGKSGLIPGLGYVSDECAYRNIIEMENNNSSDAPVFYFLVTIQNHGGFIPSDETYEIPDYVQGVTNAPELNNYLTLVNKSDEAFEYLINELSGSDKKYVVLMFGDHQPALDDVEGEEIAGGRRWVVPYVLWTNYDMSDEYEGTRGTSLNYLPLDVLNVSGIPMSPYFEYISDIRESIPALNPAGYFSREINSWCEPSVYGASMDETYLNQYYALEYYALFDSSNEW